MATLTVRGLDETLRAKLRVRAAENGRSMEAEVRAILRSVLTEPSPARGLGSRVRGRFADLEDVSIPLPARTEQPRAARVPE